MIPVKGKGHGAESGHSGLHIAGPTFLDHTTASTTGSLVGLGIKSPFLRRIEYAARQKKNALSPWKPAVAVRWMAPHSGALTWEVHLIHSPQVQNVQIQTWL